MTLAFSVNGARAVIPAVYDYLRVQDSLPAPTPTGRNILIIGEAASGIPSSLLDLQLNYFTDYNSVLAYYKSGPVVDAARQIFSAQPSPVFGGAVSRLYVYKTNNTTRAEKSIVSPTNYGKIVSAVWDEDGNLIKSQIKTAVSEVKPSKTFQYIPSVSSARTFKVVVSGKPYTTSALAAAAMPAAMASALNTAISGVASVAGGTLRSIFLTDGAEVTTTASGSLTTFAFAAGTGSFSLSTVQVGDTLVVPQASDLEGTASANCGAFIVEAVTSSTISARKVHSWSNAGADTDYVAPGSANATAIVVADQSDYATAELMVFAPITVTVTESTVNGSGATLEILNSTGSNSASSAIVDYSSWQNILSENMTIVGEISASVASSKLTVTLSGAIWQSVPAIGSVIYIDHDSPVAGSSKENVGFYLVESATSQRIVLVPTSGSTIVSVSTVAIGGVQPLKLQPAFVTSAISAARIDSASERKVIVEASRLKDNSVWPSENVGGIPVLEMSYYNSSVTAAKVSIDYRRRMVITFTGGSLSPITILLNKYRTIRELVEYINTLSGFSARVSDSRFAGFLTSVLDMVTDVNVLSGSTMPAFNGRIKKDYYDFKNHFDSNANGILAFAQGSMLLKAGLPDAESAPSYLSGATVGYTVDADIANALDSSLKINISTVVPLFSRDSVYDVEDGLTDVASDYTIASIHGAVKAHVATASTIKVKRERFAALSYHGSFASAKEMCAVQSYERTQMAFQMARAVGSNGESQWFLPWMLACCVAAGRAQAVLGTSMLRKPFNVSDIKHIGNESIYSDTLVRDFDPEDQGLLEEAIEAGLLSFKFNTGFGVQMVSPDCSTRSRMNDPQGWFYERINVQFAVDEIRATVRTVLENYIGNRTSDTSEAIITSSVNDTLRSFVSLGAITEGRVNKVVKLGNSYQVYLKLKPVEALEFISVEVTAERNI